MTFAQLAEQVAAEVRTRVDGVSCEGFAWSLGRHEAELRPYGTNEAILLLGDYEGFDHHSDPWRVRSEYYRVAAYTIPAAVRDIEKHLLRA